MNKTRVYFITRYVLYMYKNLIFKNLFFSLF